MPNRYPSLPGRARALVLALASILLGVRGKPAEQAVAPASSPGITHAGSVDRNVIYGMYSGLALLMDVHRAARPNGFGIIVIPGSGFTAPATYDATPLKETGDARVLVPPLVDAGYTTFVINHRATGRFTWPAPLEDAERAVRFIRFHATDYSISPDRIGSVGYSSGANLATMLGVLQGEGDPLDPDRVNQQSARVQCVVAGGTPADLTYRRKGMNLARDVVYLSMLLGAPVFGDEAQGSAVYRDLRRASPIAYVSPGDPPMLLFHGDQDDIVPIEQAREFDGALERAEVPHRFAVMHGENHDLLVHQPHGEYIAEMLRWLDAYLKSAR
jgi:acetyl esterase/lipase